jgi:hypothetical protein|tara:strand:- start:1144 stop:1356 length:213 start_codon:yes stop_codon:yes gene_type:complete
LFKELFAYRFEKANFDTKRIFLRAEADGFGLYFNSLFERYFLLELGDSPYVLIAFQPLRKSWIEMFFYLY